MQSTFNNARWMSDDFEIMHAIENETSKVSYLFTQKDVKRGIYYFENPKQTLMFSLNKF